MAANVTKNHITALEKEAKTGRAAVSTNPKAASSTIPDAKKFMKLVNDYILENLSKNEIKKHYFFLIKMKTKSQSHQHH